MGSVCMYNEDVSAVMPRFSITVDHIETELIRAIDALNLLADELRRLVTAARDAGDHKAADIFSAHEMILRDDALRTHAGSIIREQLINAEHAVDIAFTSFIEVYRSKSGHFAELAHDLEDIKLRAIEAFGHSRGKLVCHDDEMAGIVVAKSPLPSTIMGSDNSHLRAMVTQEGSATAHGVILARAHGIPLVYGIDYKKLISHGSIVAVDGDRGLIIVDPDDKTIASFKERERAFRQRFVQQRERITACAGSSKPVTRDGLEIALKINLESVDDLNGTLPEAASGIGLLRTEFIFGGFNPPTIEEHIQAYRKVCAFAGDKEVVVRMLDLGADKAPSFMKVAGMLDHDLGTRGARAVTMFKEIFTDQARALCRARAEGLNVSVLFPMVSDISDIDVYRGILTDAARIEGSCFSIPTGVMIETPGAAMMAYQLIREVDFANLGTNDLLQYTLAAARGDPMADSQYHVMHPAMLKLVREAVKGARKASKPLCMCGMIGSVPENYDVLLALGLRTFSIRLNAFYPICSSISEQDSDGDKGLLRSLTGKLRSKVQTDKLLRRFRSR